MTYRDGRLARAERLRGWSENNQARSDQRVAAATQISDGIPFGQPILVGHHSERRHRRDLAKIESGMRASIELERKAEDQSRRADTIEAQTDAAIYDDDPDAIERLAAKLAALESERENMKARNAEYRKAHRAELKDLTAFGRNQAMPFPSYAITNIGGNISRCRDRLARLERENVAGPRDRLISARFASDCTQCGAAIERGQMIRYNRQHGARCAGDCVPAAPKAPDGMLF